MCLLPPVPAAKALPMEVNDLSVADMAGADHYYCSTEPGALRGLLHDDYLQEPPSTHHV